MIRDIYILWLQGFDEAPEVVRLCVRSWKIHNPTWTIHLIDETNLGQYVNLNEFSEFTEDRISKTALSDLIRLSILEKHGGLWVDATVFCVKPLDDWIEKYYRPENGFVAYASDPNTELIIGSWFLLADIGNLVITKWKAAALEYCLEAVKVGKYIGMPNITLSINTWKTNKFSTSHYFWVHYIFNDLVNSDPQVALIWNSLTSIEPKLDTSDAHRVSNCAFEPLSASNKERIDKKIDNVYKLWSPNRVKYQDRKSVV